MEKLIFATNNQHKVDEIKSVIGSLFEVVSLRDAGINIDIPEPYNTLEENARIKSQTIHKLTAQNCFSEDTGLEVLALNGEPGVKSARYAGDEKEPKDNMEKLLAKLASQPDRSARFRTVISLILNGQEHQFEGICNGVITENPSGKFGFGYDPIFIPEGASKSFAEMTLTEKNKYSHRKKATAQLLQFLSLNGN